MDDFCLASLTPQQAEDLYQLIAEPYRRRQWWSPPTALIRIGMTSSLTRGYCRERLAQTHYRAHHQVLTAHGTWSPCKIASNIGAGWNVYTDPGNLLTLLRVIYVTLDETLYCWTERYDPEAWETIESKSRRPKYLRQPTAPPELVEAVLKLRERYPRRGKDKIVVLLRQHGFKTSG